MKAFIIFCLISLLALIYVVKDEHDYLNKFKSGEYKLYCLFNDGYKFVEPEKITAINGDTFIFSNGYAKNCRVEK